MLVNVAVWLNSEKTLQTEISMWAAYFSRHRQQLPFVIWRDASVQHFNTPTGLDFLCGALSSVSSKTRTPDARRAGAADRAGPHRHVSRALSGHMWLTWLLRVGKLGYLLQADSPICLP